MYAFRDPPRPRRPVLHRPVRRGQRVALRRAQPGARRRRRRARRAATTCTALLDDFAPGDELCDLVQVHGADVVVVDAQSPAPGREADALVTAEPGRRAAGAGRRLRAGAAPRTARSAWSARRTAGVPACSPGVVPRTVDAAARVGRHRRINAWIGPHVCGGCYEVPAAMQDEVAAVVPGSRADDLVGDAVARPRRRGARPARGARRRRRRREPLHPRVRRPLLLPPRRRRAPAGTAGWSGSAETGMSDRLRRDRGRARRVSRADRAGLRRRRTRPGRRPARRGHQDLPGLATSGSSPSSGSPTSAENRHQEARRPRPPSSASRPCAGTSSAACRATRRARSPTYADVVESVDRRKLVGAAGRRRPRAVRPVDVLLQVSLDPPGSEHRSGAAPSDLAELATAMRRRRSSSRCAA